MWGALLAGAFFTAINPVRLGIIALLISRPRPMQNLFAFWIGALVAGVPFVLIPLLALHAMPMITTFSQDLATSSTFRHIQLGIGVLALSIAVLMLLRSSARRKSQLPARTGSSSTLVLEPSTPNPISRLLDRPQDATSDGGSLIRRLLYRAQEAWENGALWVAAVIGMATGGPSLDGIFFGIAIIVTSGAAIGTQVGAAIVWVIAMLAVVEIILVSSVISPAKARAVLQVVHDWVQAHRRKLLIAILAVVGIAMVAQGMHSS